MMQLINNILAYTEIQAGRLLSSYAHFAVKKELNTLHAHYQQRCNEKGLQLHWTIDDKLPDWLYCDGDKVISVLHKLLDNAVKFTDKGSIGLDIKHQNHYLSCTITDSGIGIWKTQQPYIFAPFRQSEQGFQRRYGGLGIGLSICKELIDSMDGEIGLSSEINQGSSFIVSLPVKSTAAPLIIEKTSHKASDVLILVVEDNPVNQQVLCKLLEILGYNFVIANNGEEALMMLEKHTISLILMDLQMPIMDGFTCSQAIRNREDALKNIPIIAVTANFLDADKQRCT
ncbi:MAG: response regulator, partial [Pseudomonadales bacterium]|nr:response regulator [Pseudomonadales bacterium]